MVRSSSTADERPSQAGRATIPESDTVRAPHSLRNRRLLHRPLRPQPPQIQRALHGILRAQVQIV